MTLSRKEKKDGEKKISTVEKKEEEAINKERKSGTAERRAHLGQKKRE